MRMSDTFYTLSPIHYRGGDYQTGTRIGHKERKQMYRALRDAIPGGTDKAFPTKQDALDALAATDLPYDDYIACETCSMGW